MKKIVLASKNLGKIEEFKTALNSNDYLIVSRSSLNFDEEIKETSATFEGNAIHKAKTVFEKLKLPTISDDSGLEIEALNGKPGVFSARYASMDGQPCSNEMNIKKILKEMENKTNRNARMVCCLCFINQFGKLYKITETCYGQIATKPEQFNGFGFDFIFLYDGKLISKLSTIEKNKISHRGKAIKKLADNLDTWWNERF